MESVFIVAITTVIIFSVLRFLEMKYLDKEFKPLKMVIREAFVVFIASMAATFGFFYFHSSIREFFNVVTDTTTFNSSNTQIFTDAPGF